MPPPLHHDSVHTMIRHLARFAVLAILPAVGAAAEQPSPQSPELAVLNHYVGEWDVAITSSGQPFTQGHASAKWILNGRFVQQTGELQGPDGKPVVQVTTLMTYDPARKAYRSWTFLSDGSVSEGEGTWNAATRVMTTRGRKDAQGGRSTTTADFSTPDVETWKITSTDGQGNIAGEMAGTNKRRPK